ncbi:hypothetical protein JRO89_XS06G0050900 [Xanthoceras sorbifolium]|uniref:NAC domain-containing protein n=1 Tax=Xanthoceras sorbifolium TaxID=99658 RepID=A0ABQ8HWV0_9ROSI|nr:hypothetical protein JRO89_XS06G0050900 [Xanthoceras sorbifolium]
MVSREGRGFRPTDEELVSCFLKEKKHDPAFTDPDIKEVDIYQYHPCELPGLSLIHSDEKVWYFFCTLDKKYPKSDRARRTAKGGSWKKTGTDRKVRARDSNNPIGIKKTLVFYKGSNTKKENKTNWIMQEYHDEYPCNKDPVFKGKLVVCRIERKPNKKQPGDNLAYDSPNGFAEDILLEVEPQLLQNRHLPSSSNNDVANTNLMELESQLLPNQQISSNGEDQVAKYIFPEVKKSIL